MSLDRARVRAVVLDLDDTLVASTGARARAQARVRQAGIDPRAFAEMDDRWWRRFREGECSREEMWVGRWLDLGLDPEAAQRADDSYREACRAVYLRRGATRLLTALRAAGLKTVILSNGDAAVQRAKIARAGLERMVDATLIGGEIPASKPDPVTFHAALDLIGARPQEAVAVGDMLHSDVEGALLANLLAVFWLTPRGQHPDVRVVPVSSLDAVRDALTVRASPTP
jgi:putative hydrolase of the HAD superfamily